MIITEDHYNFAGYICSMEQATIRVHASNVLKNKSGFCQRVIIIWLDALVVSGSVKTNSAGGNRALTNKISIVYKKRN